MTVLTNATRRLLLAGGFALAVAAPIGAIAAYDGGSVLPAVASCPEGEVLDEVTGGCLPATGPTPTTFNPINPEGADLQPGAITSSDPGEIGQLPEVDGIPCSGANTGQCIGLSENQPTFEQPQSTLSSSP
jgi:hypothetical protein